MSDPTDTQVAGDHYKKMAIQPIRYIHSNNLTFLEGNVVKYVTRHRHKNKAADIQKAIHYLQLILHFEYPDHDAAPQSAKNTATYSLHSEPTNPDTPKL